MPIEERDRVVVAGVRTGALRSDVDQCLAALLEDDDLAPAVRVVHGDLSSRVRQVLDRMGR